MEDLYRKVLKGIYPKLPLTYSKAFRNLIRVTLQVDPESRPDIGALLEYAESNFKKLFGIQNNKELD
jgi:NIMA (never in mitosis gene a)-related kinase